MGFDDLVKKNNILEQQEEEIEILKSTLRDKLLTYHSKLSEYEKSESYISSSNTFTDTVINEFYGFFEQKGFTVKKETFQNNIEVKAELAKIKLIIWFQLVDNEITISSVQDGYPKFEYKYTIVEIHRSKKTSNVFLNSKNELFYIENRKEKMSHYLAEEIEKVETDIDNLKHILLHVKTFTFVIHSDEISKNYESILGILEEIEDKHFN